MENVKDAMPLAVTILCERCREEDIECVGFKSKPEIFHECGDGALGRVVIRALLKDLEIPDFGRIGELFRPPRHSRWGLLRSRIFRTIIVWRS